MHSRTSGTAERRLAAVGPIALAIAAAAGATRLLAAAGSAMAESMDGVFDDDLDQQAT
ncbi:hypothetical protein [Dermatobacter hominis]|uniref:hypothetical protein n=1 Tax=Dermatobacter hominis TaxID=2884263 RepID=UPI001D122DDC|nr:hypothetical protein [Dermatobacter hominis]UDY34962.1 hypothetical protein LH044_16685 [Dermatobacter hominis]